MIKGFVLSKLGSSEQAYQMIALLESTKWGALYPDLFYDWLKKYFDSITYGNYLLQEVEKKIVAFDSYAAERQEDERRASPVHESAKTWKCQRCGYYEEILTPICSLCVASVESGDHQPLAKKDVLLAMNPDAYPEQKTRLLEQYATFEVGQ